MVEFQFRAWNEEEGIMVYNNEDDSGDYLWEGSMQSEIEMVNDLVGGMYAIKNLMMYSTLTDMEGTKIFQGDLATDEDGEIIGEVVFEEGCFLFEWGNISEPLSEAQDQIKVIGNIYENPELRRIANVN